MKYTDIKTGSYVIFCKRKHLFLGYIDSKKRRCIIADNYGNKIEIWNEQILNN
jgi:hypothetical protein